MKIGYHAPPPGAATGVADYAATLLEALRAQALPGSTIERDVSRADLNIYHLGNNRLHAGIYARSLQKPGIVVMHDAVLHHFLLGTLSPEAYTEEFVYNYGEWSRHIGQELWRDRAASAADPRYFRYAMLRRAVENARAVVVHNAGAAAIAREHGAKIIHVIPHFHKPGELPDAAATERFRQRLGMSRLGISQGMALDVTLFGIFGYLRETKRVLPCIHAFRRLNAVRPCSALLIAGEIVSSDLKRLLQEETPHPAIHRLERLSETELQIAAAAVDCCLNLRYPAAGETSGIAIRLMGIGKPVIVTEGRETAHIPPSACLRVPAGSDEAAGLFDQMALVEGFPEIARQVGAAAREYIRSCHSVEDVARQYWQVIDSMRNLGI